MNELTTSFEEFIDALFDVGQQWKFSDWGRQTAFDWAHDYGMVGKDVERDVLPLFDEYPDEEEAADALGIDISHLDPGYGYPERVCKYLEEQCRVKAEAAGPPSWTVLVMRIP